MDKSFDDNLKEIVSRDKFFEEAAELTSDYLLIRIRDGDMEPRLSPGEYVLIEVNENLPLDEADMEIVLVRYRGHDILRRLDVEWEDRRPRKIFLERWDRQDRVEVYPQDEFKLRGLALAILPEMPLRMILAAVPILPRYESEMP